MGTGDGTQHPSFKASKNVEALMHEELARFAVEAPALTVEQALLTAEPFVTGADARVNHAA